jgi:hypothetical protein
VVLSQIFPARPSSIPDIRDFVRRCLAESPLNEEGTREVGETVFRALLDAAGPTGSIQVAFRIFPEHVEVDVLRSDTALTPFIPSGLTTLNGSPGRGPAGYPGGPPSGATAPPASPSPASPEPASTGLTSAAPGSAELTSTELDGTALDRAGVDSAGLNSAGLDGGSGADGPSADEPRTQARRAAAHLRAAGGDATASFAEWMATALRREGLTQEAAAQQLGVSVKTVSRWVGGATEPRLRDLRRIQERFGEVPLP